MLRQFLGDKIFIQGLKNFYKKHKFHKARFDDLREALEIVSGKYLKGFFDQWVSFPGAPKIKINNTNVLKKGKEYLLKETFQQLQSGKVYKLRVPVAITFEANSKTYQKTLLMEEKKLDIELKLPKKPLRLDVDPEFDVFRKLDRNEIPPALTQIFGAKKIMVLIPSSKNKLLTQSYRRLAKLLTELYSDKVKIKEDDEIRSLPSDFNIWILEWDNRFLAQFSSILKNYKVKLNKEEFKLGNKKVKRKDSSLVLTTKHPSNSMLTLAWVGLENHKAIPGLARKLPHYHKYSYLAFKGDEPTNIVKGKWPVLNSPLTVFLTQAKQQTINIKRGKLISRNALIPLPTTFEVKN